MQEKQFNCSLEFESNGINVLIDRELIIDGIKFYGTPYAPVFMDWCFMKEEKNLVPHWDAIPDDTNVLITHGPAYGIGDCIDGTKRHLGCKGLTRRLKHLNQLAYHFYGHIHTGKKTPDENELGFKSINCSVLNEQYKLVFPAVEVKYIS
jgi:hypothetical protein